MRRILTYLVTCVVIFINFSSCVREFEESAPVGEGEVDVALSFGAASMNIVQTRADHSLENESRIYNLHVFLFDGNGNKVYSHYFSESDRQDSDSNLWPGQWYVGSAAGGDTKGCVKMRVPQGENLKVYIYANLDADMVRVSEELLNHAIQNENDLKNFRCYLNQTTVARNGYFPMSGVLEGVTITVDNSGEATITSNNGSTLKLYRIDAKIRFTFKTGSRPDENGQIITSFEPLQWKVMNVPRTCYAINLDHDDSKVDPGTNPNDYSKFADLFFDTGYVNFETYDDASKGKPASFTFYMLENHQEPKDEGPASYQDRSRQKKNPDGTNVSVPVSYVVDGKTYERSMRVFEYANDFSTYVMVTGRVTMKLENDDAGQVLGADVTYLIHLGTWGATIKDANGGTEDEYSNFGDYGIERNTIYDYTVTVNSVNNIRVEVETSKGDVSKVEEKQPGAMGSVTIAREEIALCDAHYESKTLTFHLANFFDGGVELDSEGYVQNKERCVADKLTWEVNTPFSIGGPRVIEGIDYSDDLDYKWVNFRLNKKENDGTYSSARRKFLDPVKYPFESSTEWRNGSIARENGGNKEGDGTDGLSGRHNDGVFDIISLVKYMKEQVNKYLESPATSDFDQGYEDGKLSPKICVTAFVNEYYYEAHPLTGAKSTTLWKKFVNQPDRSVHILCNSEISKDLESRATGSVVTIQQHAIQCIYNTDESYTSLQTAWGTEYTDEFSDKVKTYNTSAYDYSGSDGNSSQENGLLNSLYEWGLCRRGSFTKDEKWGKYMEFQVPNSTPQMNDSYKSLRYLCMSRNRDNNGDGKIDASEMRWYLASIRQLIGLYVGDGLLNQNSRLYYRTSSQRASIYENVWRQHVISSTKYVSSDPNKPKLEPTLVWAEEGIATGHLSAYANKLNEYSIRCVRNLGMVLPDNPSSSDLNSKYDPWVTVSGSNTESDPYVVTCTNLNQNALRYYTSRELEYAGNESEQNRLYKKFEVCYQSKSHSVKNFQTINDEVTKIGSSSKAGYCPDGYRLPNQLELAMMRFYCNGVSKGSVSRTYWSMGVVPGTYGPYGKDNGSKYGFVDDGNITLWTGAEPDSQRCVRDIRVD